MASVNFRLDHPFQKGTRDLKPTPVGILVELYITPDFRPEISTGERILPKHWNTKTRRAKPSMTGHLELNLHLDNISADLIRVWRDHKASDAQTITRAMRLAVRGAISAEKKTSTEVTDVVKLFIAQYAKEKAQSSAKRYAVLLRKLEAFQQEYTLTLATLDFNFYDAFKNWLYAQPNPLYKDYSLHKEDDIYVLRKDNDGLPVGLLDEVVYKYFINLKTVFAWAAQRGYTVHPAYKTWQISRKLYEVISLSHDELKRLESTVMSSPRLDVARDYLALECRTGQRISDLKRFNIADVKDNKWTFTQKKGNRIVNKVVTVPFAGYCQPAYLILQKYGFKMPEISEQNLNYAIKEACKEAGIDQDIYIDRWAGNKMIRIPGKKYEFISTHTGRKTFVTIALQTMAPRNVMKMTGIRSFKTLNHYMGDPDTGEIEKQLIKIEDSTPMMKKVI